MLVVERNINNTTRLVGVSCDFCSNSYEFDENDDSGFRWKLQHLKEKEHWLILRQENGTFKHKCASCASTMYSSVNPVYK